MEIFKNTFFTKHLRTTASAFSFSEAATGCVLWKKVLLKFLYNSQENTCGLRIFQEHLFYSTLLEDWFWLFQATFQKGGTPNSVWKTSDEYSLSRNTNLRSTVQVYHFFLGSINFQCMFSLVYTVYCHKQPPEYSCSVKKGILKNFVNFTGKHLCLSLFLIKLCRPDTSFEKYLLTTADSLLLIRFTLHSVHSSSPSLLLLLISPMFAFGSIWKGFKESRSGISFSLESLPSVLFSFFMFFLSFSVLFHFFLSLS